MMYFDNASLLKGDRVVFRANPTEPSQSQLGLQCAHGESVRILDVETVWNPHRLSGLDSRLATVERVPAESCLVSTDRRRPASTASYHRRLPPGSPTRLTQDVLLAPLEAGVIRCRTSFTPDSCRHGDRVRYLLADEVGLGKTSRPG
jgi:hypothetical protein